MTPIRLSFPPSVNRCYRVFRGKFLLSGIGRKWKEKAKLELIEQKAARFGNARLNVVIHAFPPDRRRRDLDNLLKPLLDAMEGWVYDNDSQIDKIAIQRCLPKTGGRIEVFITEAAEED